MKISRNQFVILATLFLMIVATRFQHFGSALWLPDATLSVFLLAGFYLARMKLATLPVFVLLILAVGGMDYYAIAVRNVSDYCVTPAYAFLVPTYAVMMLAGRWFARREQKTRREEKSWGSLAVFGLTGFVSASLAFFISNLSFYLFAGRFGEMSMLDYASSVSQYYSSYVGYTLMYLGIAAIIHIALGRQATSSLAH